MSSPLDNLSLINHQDLICAFNSRKAMGNHNNGFTVSKIADGLLNKMFIFWINAGSCFIKDDNGGRFLA